MILVHELLCLALFYSVFCRAVRMDKSTRYDIRIGLQVLGTVAAIGMAVPVHWPSWRPDWFTLAMEASITLLQAITAHHWINGVPNRFVNPLGGEYDGPDRRLNDRRRLGSHGN